MSKWRNVMRAFAVAGFAAATLAAPTSAHAWWDSWGRWHQPAPPPVYGFGYGGYYGHSHHHHHDHGRPVYHREGHWDRHGDHYDWHDTSHYDYVPAPAPHYYGGW